MVRKRTFTNEQLLEKTEELLILYGYDQFHLKLLSAHLDGARSTIYSYYKSKEEIVSACMHSVMQRVLERTEEIEATDSIEALKQLLRTYIQESDLHRILKEAGKIEGTPNSAIMENKRFLEEGHQKLQQQLAGLCIAAQQEGRLRKDIHPAVFALTFITLIDVPNPLGMDLDAWIETLFDLWLNGASKK